MPSLDPLVKFSSLVFVIFTAALTCAIVLPKVRQSRGYQILMAWLRPVLPYFGWLFLMIGSIWAIWGLFQPGDVKLIVALGITLSVLGVYVVRIGYEDPVAHTENATNLKIVTLCTTFSFVFAFLLLYGTGIIRVIQ